VLTEPNAHSTYCLQGKAGAREAAGIREILTQSQVHFQKYRQIREDYNRLLYKWVRRGGQVGESRGAEGGGGQHPVHSQHCNKSLQQW
jgi:hypothetical protein